MLRRQSYAHLPAYASRLTGATIVRYDATMTKPPKRTTILAHEYDLRCIGEVSGALAKGQLVEIPGFGTFRPTTRKARNIRDVRSGKMMRLKAMKSVHFRPSKALREVL